MEYLVIDGYNVLNAWEDVFDMKEDSLENCREKLLHILSNYQGYKKLQIIVVFDAHMVKGSQQKNEKYDNLTVVFTKENETADNYIERFVYRLGSSCTIRVVTSDYLEQTMIMSKGGIRMSPRELKEEVGLVSASQKKAYAENHGNKNTIMSNVNPEILEKLEKLRRETF